MIPRAVITVKGGIVSEVIIDTPIEKHTAFSILGREENRQVLEQQSRAYMPEAQSQEWQTPTRLFNALWEEFGGFTLDPCGQREHRTVTRILEHGGSYYDGTSAAMDGLSQSWRGKVYMNPPYGRVLSAWVRKAVNEVRLGNVELVVALLPARTDVAWWQQYVIRRTLRDGEIGVKAEMAASEVRFLPGRLRFRREEFRTVSF